MYKYLAVEKMRKEKKDLITKRNERYLRLTSKVIMASNTSENRMFHTSYSSGTNDWN